jgi:hypothetical protein
VGAGRAERELLVVAAVERGERIEVEAGEDQLAVEAEAIEHGDAIGAVPRAERVVVLVQQDRRRSRRSRPAP